MNYAPGDYALMFKALSDETRLRIVCQLCGGEELCACNLLDSLSITQPTLSYHMKLLGDCGLVHSRKDGNWMKYTINVERVGEMQQFLEGLKSQPEQPCCPGKSCGC